MSALLNQALSSLNLQPGQTYRTMVNGHAVEVRMLDAPRPEKSAAEALSLADMSMLEPWFAIPDVPIVGTIRVQRGTLQLPDLPSIPPEDEETE